MLGRIEADLTTLEIAGVWALGGLGRCGTRDRDRHHLLEARTPSSSESSPGKKRHNPAD